jgi:molybdopterin converting factor small subunit
MRVVIRYFAGLKEARGTDSESVELPDGCTAAEAYRCLKLPEGLPVAYAVNLDRVPAGTRLAEGDEVVFLPPIGGG